MLRHEEGHVEWPGNVHVDVSWDLKLDQLQPKGKGKWQANLHRAKQERGSQTIRGWQYVYTRRQTARIQGFRELRSLHPTGLNMTGPLPHATTTIVMIEEHVPPTLHSMATQQRFSHVTRVHASTPAGISPPLLAEACSDAAKQTASNHRGPACRRLRTHSPCNASSGPLKNSAVAFNQNGGFLGVWPMNLGKLAPTLRCWSEIRPG